jgi:hypothetical protein
MIYYKIKYTEFQAEYLKLIRNGDLFNWYDMYKDQWK